MISHYKIIMDDSEINLARKKLYQMHELWECDTGEDIRALWIFGAIGNFLNDDSKIERRLNYLKHLKQINKVILDNFSHIYDKIKNEAYEVIGDCGYDTDILGLPVFQIFGCKPDSTNTEKDYNYYKNYTFIHSDVRKFQTKILKEKYKIVEENKILSLTFCLELPSEGGGIFVWTKEKDILKYSTNNAKIQKLKTAHKYFNGELPIYVPYKEGSLFIFESSDTHHCVAQPQINNDNDRRITIQAFAIKCDGIWRMFF